MADSRDLLVRILGDDRSLQQAFTRTERRSRQFESRTSKVGTGLSRGFAAAGITLGASAGLAAANRFVQAASDLNEQLTRSNTIFDESAASVERWSEEMASSFGIAQAQALQFAGTFGLLFRNLGSSAPEAEKFSKQLVELAADLASFNNTDVETALNALRSGLTGEIEPLRKFGVFLSEARARQEAFAKTGKRTAAELTNQDKVLARLSIVMADTSRAQGDFARTSDTLANRQRKAAAEAQNLAANFGRVLAPAMDIALVSTIALVGGINDLVDGMEGLRGSLRDSDMFDGFNEAVEEANRRATGFFENLRENIPLLDRAAQLRGAVVGDGRDGFSAPGRGGGLGGRGKDLVDGVARDAKALAQAAAEAERELRRGRNAFAGFLKGLGLKLDRAGLTASLDDDLSVLQEIERAIRRRIRAEGRTFALVQQLTNVQLQIASNLESQQVDAQQRQDDAVARAQEKQQKALEARQERIEREAERRRRQIERRQERQFSALNLTSEGDKRVPGVGALRKRLGNLRQAVEGTVLDTQKTDQQLDRIAKVLSGKFGKVGKEVREAILQMFNDISGALGQGDKKVGPLTKTSSLNSKKLLAGIGLSPEEIRELRGRLSNFNSSGMGNAGANNRPSGGGFTGGTGWVIENNVTVAIDGQKFSAVVTKQQQKQKRRNPKQKRGPNRNR